MPAVPFKQPGPTPQAPLGQPVPPYAEVTLTGGPALAVPEMEPINAAHILAAGTLVTGAILMLTGRRRAAAAVAAAGTAVVLLQEQEAVKEWWETVPVYLAKAQQFLDRIESTLEEVSNQGQRLQSLLRR